MTLQKITQKNFQIIVHSTVAFMLHLRYNQSIYTSPFRAMLSICVFSPDYTAYRSMCFFHRAADTIYPAKRLTPAHSGAAVPSAQQNRYAQNGERPGNIRSTALRISE